MLDFYFQRMEKLSKMVLDILLRIEIKETFHFGCYSKSEFLLKVIAKERKMHISASF
jgi:hypothetical protein